MGVGQSWAPHLTPIRWRRYIPAYFWGNQSVFICILDLCPVKFGLINEPLHALRLVSVILLCKGPGSKLVVALWNMRGLLHILQADCNLPTLL